MSGHEAAMEQRDQPPSASSPVGDDRSRDQAELCERHKADTLIIVILQGAMTLLVAQSMATYVMWLGWSTLGICVGISVVGEVTKIISNSCQNNTI